ncbi:hypothetical protein GNI_191170, partial [Gregarina niphandrodes]
GGPKPKHPRSPSGLSQITLPAPPKSKCLVPCTLQASGSGRTTDCRSASDIAVWFTNSQNRRTGLPALIISVPVIAFIGG